MKEKTNFGTYFSIFFYGRPLYVISAKNPIYYGGLAPDSTVIYQYKSVESRLCKKSVIYVYMLLSEGYQKFLFWKLCTYFEFWVIYCISGFMLTLSTSRIPSELDGK